MGAPIGLSPFSKIPLIKFLLKFNYNPAFLQKEVKRKWSHSAVSDSLQPHGLQPIRLLSSWDFPGKNTGVGYHFLLQGDLPNPGIEPRFPALYTDTLPSEPPGKLNLWKKKKQVKWCLSVYSRYKAILTFPLSVVSQYCSERIHTSKVNVSSGWKLVNRALHSHTQPHSFCCYTLR